MTDLIETLGMVFLKKAVIFSRISVLTRVAELE